MGCEKKKNFPSVNRSKAGNQIPAKCLELFHLFGVAISRQHVEQGRPLKTRQQSFYISILPLCFLLSLFHGCSPLVLNLIKTCINYRLSWSLKGETKGREFSEDVSTVVAPVLRER